MACHELTADLARLIVALIRAGASPGAAAEAAGVPRKVFTGWLRRGRDSGEPPYGPFYQQVLEARGQVRAALESEIRKKDPKFWLRYGPGKTTGKRARQTARNEIPPWLIEVVRAVELLPAEAREVLLSCADKLDGDSDTCRKMG